MGFSHQYFFIRIAQIIIFKKHIMKLFIFHTCPMSGLRKTTRQIAGREIS